MYNNIDNFTDSVKPNLNNYNLMMGNQIGDFIILDIIGHGGMGTVYLAFQKTLEREIALKIINVNGNLSSQEHVERFMREAKIAASIQHPNIVNIYSVGKEGNYFYIAMEYIMGLSLEAMIAKGAIPELFVWNIALQICNGLQRVLEKEVIHRDIKPGNILININNEVKITDFGLSKRLDDQSTITQAGMILGTPQYISPEQVTKKEVDFRSDIYSLGATIYHALTGNMVFNGESCVDIMMKHCRDFIIPPQEYVPSLKPESSMILGKMLQKRPKDRYMSYGEIIADITALLNDKPLLFTVERIAYSIYKYNPPKIRRKNTSYFLSRLVPKKNKEQLTSIKKTVLVSSLSYINLKNFHTESNIDIHIVSVLPELRVYLKSNPQCTSVILDYFYLKSSIITFCESLKNEFPDISVLILADKNPFLPETSESLIMLILSSRYDEKKLVQIISQCMDKICFKARCIDLNFIIKFCQGLNLTITRILINKGTEKEKVISLKSDKIVDVRENKMVAIQDLDSLIAQENTWTLDTKVTHEIFNIRNVKEKAESTDGANKSDNDPSSGFSTPIKDSTNKSDNDPGSKFGTPIKGDTNKSDNDPGSKFNTPKIDAFDKVNRINSAINTHLRSEDITQEKTKVKSDDVGSSGIDTKVVILESAKQNQEKTDEHKSEPKLVLDAIQECNKTESDSKIKRSDTKKQDPSSIMRKIWNLILIERPDTKEQDAFKLLLQKKLAQILDATLSFEQRFKLFIQLRPLQEIEAIALWNGKDLLASEYCHYKLSQERMNQLWNRIQPILSISTFMVGEPEFFSLELEGMNVVFIAREPGYICIAIGDTKPAFLLKKIEFFLDLLK